MIELNLKCLLNNFPENNKIFPEISLFFFENKNILFGHMLFFSENKKRLPPKKGTFDNSGGYVPPVPPFLRNAETNEVIVGGISD